MLALFFAVLASGGPERFSPLLAPDAAITLEAHWGPFARSAFGLFQENGSLQAPCVNVERQRYVQSDLAPLLPPRPVELGEVWPVPTAAVLTFLRQLHSGATDKLHHGFGSAPGAFACLRAQSDERLEILLRAHAEFTFEDGTTLTPGQFEGRLVLERESGRVLAFRLALPARDPNVDVNVPVEFSRGDSRVERFMSADIGFVPRLELTSGAEVDEDTLEGLSLAEARHRLAHAFYPHEELAWLPLDEALRVSRDEQKPLHVVLLFGVLDDESC
ncbi:MAG: hypothetical protein ABL998_16210 [Planctomycetota bacterium]